MFKKFILFLFIFFGFCKIQPFTRFTISFVNKRQADLFRNYVTINCQNFPGTCTGGTLCVDDSSGPGFVKYNRSGNLNRSRVSAFIQSILNRLNIGNVEIEYYNN